MEWDERFGGDFIVFFSPRKLGKMFFQLGWKQPPSGGKGEIQTETVKGNKLPLKTVCLIRN